MKPNARSVRSALDERVIQGEKPIDPKAGTSRDSAASADKAIIERVRYVVDLIRPAVQADGGDVELVEVTNSGVAKIRLHGACVGCPSSTVTLHHGIERNIREHIPEIRCVEAIE
jgi:Fe-S cluster biogenesis protein NfuA